MVRFIAFIFVLNFSISAICQEENWLSFPAQTDDSTATSTTLDYSVEDGKVDVHKDARIDKIAEFVRSGEESVDGVLIDGYRVLIYFDQDKAKSEQQKARFMQMFDDHKAYVDYLAPNYRVRVGNFRTKLEAEKMKQQILEIFPTAIVVKDKIQLPVIEEPNAVQP